MILNGDSTFVKLAMKTWHIMERSELYMKKINIGKPNSGMVWSLVGAAATIIGLIASNKKEASTMDSIAEKAADIVEKRNSEKL